MKRSLFALASLVLFAALVIPENAHARRRMPTPVEVVDGLVGSWRPVSMTRANEARDAAVARVASEFGIIARGIARRRLTRGLPVPNAIVISRVGDPANNRLRVKVGGYDYSGVLGSRATAATDPFDNDGRMAIRLRSTTLSQRFTTDEGSVLQHRMRRTRNGVSLTVRVTDERLPSSVQYNVRYRAR